MSERLTYKFSVCRTIATGGVTFILAGALSCSGDVQMFIHVPSFIFVFGICFFLLLGSFGIDFLKFIPASLTCLACSPSRPSPRYAEIAKFGSRYIVGAAVVGGLLGVISMMQNLSDPSGIGAGIAVAMIGPFYAIVSSEIFLAFVYKAFSDSDPNARADAKETPTLPLSNILIPLLVFGFIIGVFYVSLVAFASPWEP
jgi:flagellar motor component MotA